MLSLLFFVGLFASCLVKPNTADYSYSGSVGGGGIAFASSAKGRITGIRVWEIQSQYITGIQLRHNYIWSKVFGRVYGPMLEMSLFDGEGVVQVSGKYHSNYIYQLIFITSRGRSLTAGQPYQKSFNFYPTHPESELRMLSGRHNGNGITALGAHWATGLNSNSTSE
ncbi:zymogen granule membrane protein 16-like [Platichthys flesus]|uniref:zymogen granule membrane protein 16-like n=1 Tax=Platichthys flesus TaxID=8260 RepID=UPI002DB63ECE|nr:zymogen granule membrane protein 16-like [Platichthys flesus]